ncbi:hypothetical protein [Pseudomonas sp. Leaf129]|uniref:hypothetical protein n=1 Tax=Pseudomonas sp. Leaf129 TaxID=1736268 RepID=UPI0012E7E6A7|nr:hypothetical protein [Pseudomonas sp. Leaf129]
MKIDIPLPSIADQQADIFEAATEDGIQQLRGNLNAKRFPGLSDFDEGQFPRTHLLREHEGWTPPPPEIVEAYFRHFQNAFPEHEARQGPGARNPTSG